MIVGLVVSSPRTVVAKFALVTLLLHLVNVDGSDESTGFKSNRPYEIWKPQFIQETVLGWRAKYPNLVRVETAQESFGLPTAGGNNDCPFDEDTTGCYNYFVTIQDFVAHPENSESSNRLPEVLWSGALHGNERVGPTSVMEAADLLLLSASCEAKPHLDRDGDDGGEGDNDTRLGHSLQSDTRTEGYKKGQVDKAKNCRKELQQAGIDDVHRKWLARLVSTRRLIVVPTANALGYFRNTREEGRTDPNRDFPFDITRPKACMQTIAGRTLNEIFRQHMFQLSFTFHAGMEVISYEWGAPTYLGSLSPDHIAQTQIAKAYSSFGGKFPSSKQYNYGTMNDLVYPVKGGMEDWAYAASWDPDRVIQCQPDSFNGYDRSKTIYSNATLRVFNMLVETSDRKTPLKKNLGHSYTVMDQDNVEQNGHISRNMRLALSALDLVQPYVSVVGVNDLLISDDIVPLTPNKQEITTCQNSKMIMVPQSTKNQQISIQWTVGGSLTIQKTQLWYAKWDDLVNDGNNQKYNCLMQPTPEVIKEYFQDDSKSNVFKKAKVTGASSGTGYFNDKHGPTPVLSTNTNIRTLGPVFQGVIDFSQEDDLNIKQNDKIIVVASAIVDQDWKDPPEGKYKPHTSPQSHVVNARTNPDWYFESQDNTDGATKIIQGQIEWFSVPATIVFGHYNDNIGKKGHLKPDSGKGDLIIDTIDLSNRFGETHGGFVGGVTPSSNIASSTNDDDNIITSLFSGGFTMFLVLGIIVFTGAFLLLRKKRNSSRKRRYSNDNNFTSNGIAGYQDCFEDDDDDYDDDDDDDDSDYDDNDDSSNDDDESFSDEEERSEYGLGSKNVTTARGRSTRSRRTVNSTAKITKGKSEKEISSNNNGAGKLSGEVELGRIS